MWKLLCLTALAHGLVPKLPARSVRASRSALQMHDFDYDVVIVGCGVGGHGAALHARSQGLSCAVLSGGDVGGTCVNRGCVPSKALLAASGRVRDMGDEKHLESMGITVPGGVEFDRAGIAAHAEQLVNKVRGGLEGSLGRLGVELIPEFGAYGGPNTVELGNGKKVTAQDIILAPGSVPPGIIGLEFSDVYTALGSECTLIEALPKLMPAFDREIAKQAERLLLTPRGIDYRTGVFASKVTPGKLGEKPVVIEMIDAETKELVEVLEVDTCMVATGRVPNTGKLGLDKHGIETPRGFVQVDETMRVLAGPGGAVADEHLYCIGDANGIQMLAHTASTQGVSAIENICGRKHVVNHEDIPAACFTHRGRPALAEGEGDGIAKVLFNKDTEQILGVHIIGLHAADLIRGGVGMHAH
ncbi:dihydrolipoyl dehydrogenase [Aureococcus anophagefferens]|nr:dihydrolipoyl dehydrogenase [Aureococcus anophagefferens]